MWFYGCVVARYLSVGCVSPIRHIPCSISYMDICCQHLCWQHPTCCCSEPNECITFSHRASPATRDLCDSSAQTRHEPRWRCVLKLYPSSESSSRGAVADSAQGFRRWNALSFALAAGRASLVTVLRRSQAQCGHSAAGSSAFAQPCEIRLGHSKSFRF